MATILLVDDEPAVLNLCQTMLKRGGHEVFPAGNGEEALRLIESATSPIDLALLDVMMPGMNGVELAKRIQAADSGITVVLMTGFGPDEIRRVTGDPSPYRIIWKPFKNESLLRMIDNALDAAGATN